MLTLGIALDAAGDHDKGQDVPGERLPRRGGDFTEMSPSTFSENTYFSILAARRLGEFAYADELVAGLTRHIERLSQTPASIDYFATSLPSLILFDEDPQRRLDLAIELLRAQLALLGNDPVTARRHLDAILATDPSHELARDLTDHIELAGSVE